MQTIRRDIKLAIIGAVFVLLAWHLVKDIDSVPFHGDESWWVTSSDFQLLLFAIDVESGLRGERLDGSNET